MLLDAGGDGEDVGVEDDVLWRKADLFRQKAIAALNGTDLDGRTLKVNIAKERSR